MQLFFFSYETEADTVKHENQAECATVDEIVVNHSSSFKTLLGFEFVPSYCLIKVHK